MKSDSSVLSQPPARISQQEENNNTNPSKKSKNSSERTTTQATTNNAQLANYRRRASDLKQIVNKELITINLFTLLPMKFDSAHIVMHLVIHVQKSRPGELVASSS
jgi:hypothetical protein